MASHRLRGLADENGTGWRERFGGTESVQMSKLSVQNLSSNMGSDSYLCKLVRKDQAPSHTGIGEGPAWVGIVPSLTASSPHLLFSNANVLMELLMTSRIFLHLVNTSREADLLDHYTCRHVPHPAISSQHSQSPTTASMGTHQLGSQAQQVYVFAAMMGDVPLLLDAKVSTTGKPSWWR